MRYLYRFNTRFNTFYFNTRVPTQLSTSPTQVNTHQHESDTSQHESTRVNTDQRESDTTQFIIVYRSLVGKV